VPLGRTPTAARCRNVDRATGVRSYGSLMYRALVIFPQALDHDEVERLIEGIAKSFRRNAGLQQVTRSDGPLMGPGARAGTAGSILEADFTSLEDVMAALQDQEFQDIKGVTESVGTTILLFECTTL
jgi:hypothetical protein